ncbi:hypothetical protein CH64_2254 [Yersinia rohdei]|uniref:Uncharacterized protein n=1 Tax=Yersinia rohdei TaxID=29485 RepID=A0ABM5SD68_YERRO|nr:hypothetical protein CH64_2254 [Yersinia rohdei]OWF82178.1 hypothetical protein B4900_01435 [Yersinia rohdei]CNF30750.1 Uncharacterised protein [Yersinia rohdei]
MWNSKNPNCAAIGCFLCYSIDETQAATPPSFPYSVAQNGCTKKHQPAIKCPIKVRLAPSKPPHKELTHSNYPDDQWNATLALHLLIPNWLHANTQRQCITGALQN